MVSERFGLIDEIIEDDPETKEGDECDAEPLIHVLVAAR